jgi:hypothetical protein
VPKCDKLAENCWICEKDLTLQKKQWALQSPKKVSKNDKQKEFFYLRSRALCHRDNLAGW